VSSAAPIPYSRQWIEEDDVDAVVNVLRSPYLTTGPVVDAFETEFARFVGTREAVAISSGTAALHVAMASLGLSPGDEVIVPSMTFVATANAAVYCGATPVFADVDPETLLIDPESVERRITNRTRLIVGVDYAGQPCDYARLEALSRSCNAALLADSCHSLGSSEDGRMVGSLADTSVFSFHPVKPITSGEGGMVTTNDAGLADRVRRLRNHGIDRDSRERSQAGSWQYEMASLGFNYRLSDIHCALGLSQLGKCERRRKRREQIAGRYQEAFGELPSIRCLSIRPRVTHAWHLFVVRVDFLALGRTRRRVFGELQSRGIHANVHYLPVHLHRYYRERWSTKRGLCPNAEAAYEQILSLPIHAAMTDDEVQRVIEELGRLLGN
jgi:perosamine synthetase